MSHDETELLDRLHAGDVNVLGDLLTLYRSRLKAMVQLRLDRRVQGRVDASDVIQDACLEAATRVQEFVDKKPMTFFLWLRYLVGEQMITQHRRHLGAAKRDARREISLFNRLPEASTALLAARLIGSLTAPSEAAVRAENRLEVEEALNSMSELDREIIALRHFEQLSRFETAQVLGIQESACSKRYVRAMQRLGDVLKAANT
ncbi:MAG: sigma-70 family RNA polymerase sigma factor [Planctomycetaceae bacterium]